MKLTDLTGKQVEVKNCLGCEIVEEKISVMGGLIFKGKHFSIAQDIELPINGFIILSSNRHIEKFIELTQEEQFELNTLIHKTLKILEKNSVAEEYNIILEEKKGVHLHVWLMPRHKWMIEKFGKVLKNVKEIQKYAKENMRIEENLSKIQQTCNLLKSQLNK